MGYVLGGIKRLEVLRENPQFRNKLWEIAMRLQNGLKAEGFNLENYQQPCDARGISTKILHKMKWEI